MGGGGGLLPYFGYLWMCCPYGYYILIFILFLKISGTFSGHFSILSFFRVFHYWEPCNSLFKIMSAKVLNFIISAENCKNCSSTNFQPPCCWDHHHTWLVNNSISVWSTTLCDEQANILQTHIYMKTDILLRWSLTSQLDLLSHIRRTNYKSIKSWRSNSDLI